MNLFFSSCIAALLTYHSTRGLSLPPQTTTRQHHLHTQSSSRRSILSTIGTAIPLLAPRNVQAATAVDAQFIEVGQQQKPPNGEAPFVILPDGVQIKDFRPGAGERAVQSGSTVELTLRGRMLNLNGALFYDTKSNDPDGFGEGTPLLFVVGDGTVLPGLESGILGMKRGGIRRIIVPAAVGYGAFPGLEPQPFTEMERRTLDSVVKNPRRDSTVLFDVKVERVR
ncbi:hypothetical protein ACHAW6_007528 [Cyclotella cf. meneghiniana]